MNIQEFCNKLENAEARSESVIAVFVTSEGHSVCFNLNEAKT